MHRNSGLVPRCALFVMLVVLVQASLAHGQNLYGEQSPDARFSCPQVGGTSAVNVSTDFTLRFAGFAPNSPSRRPLKYRVLFKPALDPSGSWVTSAYQYQQCFDYLVGWDDPGWTEWIDYPVLGDHVELQFPGSPVNGYYIVALQVMDRSGAVSLGRGYNQQVGNFAVRAGYYRPDLTVTEPFLGQATASAYETAIAGGQRLNFSWSASAGQYCGQIASLRHGWDLVDPEDPYDPGWEVPPGLEARNRYASERQFDAGLHTFHLRVVDDAAQSRLFVWYLRVIPFVDPIYQLPLLVIDQVIDRNSSAWPSSDGRPLNDQVYRNAYWHFLAEGYGGVAGFNWARDWKNHTAAVTYEDLVAYKAVLCYAFADITQSMFKEFRQVGTAERFVWLTPYQQQGGNLMLVGGSSMESFLQLRSNYMVPMVFDTTEERMTIDGTDYVTGFGTRTNPDGSVIQRGPQMYPYATAGISALDWTAPITKFIYGRTILAGWDRNRLCAGLKGLVLPPAFKANHLVGFGALADTIFTDTEIDWRDAVAAAADTLSLFDQLAFPFGSDEFINANIGMRPTPFTPQECAGLEYAGVNAPSGMCVEPMYTGIARLDWMREQERARGDTNWPSSRYSAAELEEGCGTMALTGYEGQAMGSALTNGQVFGYLSYKSVPNKPSRKADVYWGFDPYRFDHAQTKQALRWVLEYFGLTINR